MKLPYTNQALLGTSPTWALRHAEICSTGVDCALNIQPAGCKAVYTYNVQTKEWEAASQTNCDVDEGTGSLPFVISANSSTDTNIPPAPCICESTGATVALHVPTIPFPPPPPPPPAPAPPPGGGGDCTGCCGFPSIPSLDEFRDDVKAQAKKNCPTCTDEDLEQALEDAYYAEGGPGYRGPDSGRWNDPQQPEYTGAGNSKNDPPIGPALEDMKTNPPCYHPETDQVARLNDLAQVPAVVRPAVDYEPGGSAHKKPSTPQGKDTMTGNPCKDGVPPKPGEQPYTPRPDSKCCTCEDDPKCCTTVVSRALCPTDCEFSEETFVNASTAAAGMTVDEMASFAVLEAVDKAMNKCEDAGGTFELCGPVVNETPDGDPTTSGARYKHSTDTDTGKAIVIITVCYNCTPAGGTQLPCLDDPCTPGCPDADVYPCKQVDYVPKEDFCDEVKKCLDEISCCGPLSVELIIDEY